MKSWLHTLLLTSALLLTAGCNSYGTDNTPTPTSLSTINDGASIVKLWSASSGEGVGEQYIKLAPSLDNHRLFTADAKGRLTAFNATTGKRLWYVSTGLPITAGPVANQGLIIVGTSNAIVAAFDEQDGKLVWQVKAPSEILAAPTPWQGIVAVKTIDGQLTTLDLKTGAFKWHHQEDVPSLVLRAGSSVLFYQDTLIAGFENGKISAFEIATGKRLWQQAIANPLGNNVITNMIDIDATPIIHDQTLYAASYQGNIASLSIISGQPLWAHKISTFSGIAVDSNHVFVSEANSSITAFDRSTGAIAWTQKGLLYRKITGPVCLGDTLIVGDSLGMLHVMSTKTGDFLARTRVTRKPLLATPLVVGDRVYVNAANGYLAAYRVTTP